MFSSSEALFNVRLINSNFSCVSVRLEEGVTGGFCAIAPLLSFAATELILKWNSVMFEAGKFNAARGSICKLPRCAILQLASNRN